MRWSVYVVFSCISGVSLIVVACLPKTRPKERVWLIVSGVCIGGYGLYAGRQTSGYFVFPVAIFIIPLAAVIAVVSRAVMDREDAGRSSVGGASATPAGWYADPFGRAQQRYWDGRHWTEQAAVSGVTFVSAVCPACGVAANQIVHQCPTCGAATRTSKSIRTPFDWAVLVAAGVLLANAVTVSWGGVRPDDGGDPSLWYGPTGVFQSFGAWAAVAAAAVAFLGLYVLRETDPRGGAVLVTAAGSLAFAAAAIETTLSTVKDHAHVDWYVTFPVYVAMIAGLFLVAAGISALAGAPIADRAYVTEPLHP